MRRILLGTTAFYAASLFCSLAGAEPQDARAPTSITIEALYLGQKIEGASLITAEDLPAVASETFDRGIGDLGVDPIAGARVSWTLPIYGNTWSFSAFTTSEWSGKARFFDFTFGESTNFSYSQTGGRDVDTENSEQAHAYEIEYASRLSSAEALLQLGQLKRERDSIHLSVGARAFLYRYDLDTVVYDDPGSFSGTGNNIDRVSAEGTSFMIGPQVAASIEVPLSKDLKLGATIKAGVFASVNNTDSTFSSDDGTNPDLARDKHSVTLGHAMELAPRAEIRINERASITASGLLLWIDGIAEASREFQMVSNSRAGVVGDGHAFFYGGTIGLTYRFGGDEIFHSTKDAPAVYRSLTAPASSDGGWIQAEAVYLNFDGGKVRVATGDDDVGTRIGRDITAQDIGSDGNAGVSASVNIPTSRGDLQLMGTFVGNASSDNRFFDANARTSPSYTFATRNSVTPTNSVGVAVLALEQEESYADASATMPIPIVSRPGAQLAVNLGLRGIYYGFDLASAAYAGIDDYNGIGNSVDRAHVEGRNFMVGPQIGVDARLDLIEGASFTASAKAGIFLNWMAAERSFSSDNNPANTHSADAKDLGYARGLEISGQLEIPITARMSLKGSGRLLWLDGITDAAEQFELAANAKSDIDGNGHTTVYAATVGIKVRLD